MSTKPLLDVDACVFDAYGTLFDFNSAASVARSELGEDWQHVSDLWRQKQLQYTWLRGLGYTQAAAIGRVLLQGEALEPIVLTL
jgi:2-haloacid dehalogenase